jgi:rhodanese-related sulfurtransferase
MSRISVDELYQLRQQGIAPIIIDIRSVVLQQTSRIPGAITIPGEDIDVFVLAISPAQEVILYCACPNEVSAAIVVKQLMQKRGKARASPCRWH